MFLILVVGLALMSGNIPNAGGRVSINVGFLMLVVGSAIMSGNVPNAGGRVCNNVG